MFGFDGDFRRRPIQKLGGVSIVTDRESIIKKAAEERAKRNDLRRKNNGAIVLQSYTRSFVARQRKKELERLAFDDYVRQNREKIFEDEKLCYLLRRLVFFYNSKNIKDCERLIELCQHILRQPDRLLRHSTADYIWFYRLRRLLDMCITQLNVPQMSGQLAIPMRMLETFTAKASIERFVEGASKSYLEGIFSFLVERNYFHRLRLILEHKCPPLDGETLQPPNPITEALFQLILRPLSLISQCAADQPFSSANLVCESFATSILAAPYTEPIRSYLLPSLAAQSEFPFEQLLLSLGQLIRDCQLDFVDLDKEENSSQRSAFTATSSAIAMAMKSNDEQKSKNKAETFTSFLMNSILILDRANLATLKSRHVFVNYISTIAHISSNILKLPKPVYKCEDHHRRNQEHDSSDDDDDDDNERDNDAFAKREASFNKTKGLAIDFNASAPLGIQEKSALLEVVDLLNDSSRVEIIVEHADELSSDEVLRPLCEICHNLMVYSKIAIFEYKLLYTLAFRPQFIRSIWLTLATQTSFLGFAAPLSLISKGVVPKEDGVKRTIPLLATFCMLFGRLLPTLHDAEFCDEKLLIEKPLQLASHLRLMPFSIAEIVQLSKTLKEISLGLVELAFPETRSNLNQHYRIVLGRTEFDDKKMRQQKQIWSNLLKVVVYVLNQIHTRDLRLRFCPESHWTVSRLDLPLDRPTDLPLTRGSRTRGIRPFQPIRDFTREDYENGPPMSTKQIRSITILREIPFVVSFSKRVGILQGLVQADKMRVQGNFQDFLQGPSIMITVRRSHLYEDAYDKLRPENEPDLRVKFRVQFISSLGLDEAGIDGGGVFREFLSELLKTSFDPNRGFFMVTTDNKLYPNPNVADLVPDNFEKHYYFIGRILGKAIYENLLVELPLAEFFLTKLAGKYADVDIHQLASLDPELYKNLLYLKDYEGDVSELGLDFTITTSSFGQTQIVELKPNGQNIHVTISNRIEYLQLMADYKLNVQIKRHCTAFRRGLSNVLPVEWLYMFSNKELQILISGAEIPIDLKDLQKHCKYGGNYSPEHPAIITFWKVVENFNDSERRQLLKFVTSCSRPPLLGFKDLDPPFFIQNASDMERLPTASTCTNLLKLPPFTSEEVMREKLLYAIQSGVGFELS